MEEFRFKQFSVSHRQSTMKVGTDAVLLGALANVDENCKRVLDVGTGCGIIALMLAQRSSALIDAIDIDENSVIEARENFQHSPWSNRLNSIHSSFQDFSSSGVDLYDLIVSNPPFFQNSLLPKNERFILAKHNQQLNFGNFLHASARLLSPTGKLAIILPVNESEIFTQTAGSMNFFLTRCYAIIPVIGKVQNRKVMLFSKENDGNPICQEIMLRSGSGKFSDEYKLLTQDFHPDEYFI